MVTKDRDKVIAALACVACRQQHVKCGGQRPSCSRCFEKGISCEYLASRRGGRRVSRKEVVHRRTAEHPATPLSRFGDGMTDDSTVEISSSTGVEDTSLARPLPSTIPSDESIYGAAPGHTRREGLTVYSTNDSANPARGPVDTPQRSAIRNGPTSHLLANLDYDSDRYLRLFYDNFHPAHPILVPSSMFAERAYPPYLRLVVHFAGSSYVRNGKSEELKAKVATELAMITEPSACIVQAWLLYSMILFSRDEYIEAKDAHGRSTRIALEIGMNHASFANSSHHELSIEAESLRRTWWELFVSEVVMSVPLGTVASRCSTAPCDVPLPCEESLYAGNRQLPKPYRMAELKRRALAAEDTVFSSFSYRIEASMILGRVLVLNKLREYHHDHFQSIQNALVSWSNYLPPAKMEIIDSYGNVDEIMFQAHAFIAYASMLLHLPRSDLHGLLPNHDDPFWPHAPAHPSASIRLLQSIKATDASRRMSDYISLCPNIQRHTPFLTPALTLCGMIQIAIAVTHSGDCFEHHYNRITLILGCLKNMRRTWHLAETAYDRVRSCAAELLSESLEKWNTEPLLRPLDGSLTTATDESGHANTVAEGLTATTTIHDAVFSELDPYFVDSICINPSFFSSLPGIDLS